jgi:hypothetical protein
VEWFKDLGDGLFKSVTLSWDAEFVGDTGARYNQGWIINRIMEIVPATEPYARGETLFTAAKAAVLPRILAPDKHKAGGQEYMDRFAGMNFTADSGTTSMNLGYAGEMYANFGYWGGIAGCFGYALVLGLAYRLVSFWAAKKPLWWAFVLYIGLNALKAEDGIAEVLNWLVKASFVTAVIYFIFPALRAALSGSGSLVNEDQTPSVRKAEYRRLRAEAAWPRLTGKQKMEDRRGKMEEVRPADPPLTFNNARRMQRSGAKWQRRQARRAEDRR